MILYFLKETMSRHNLCNIMRITSTMNKKTDSFDGLNKRISLTKSLCHHVCINLVPRDLCGPVLMFLDEGLEIHALNVKVHHRLCHTKPLSPITTFPASCSGSVISNRSAEGLVYPWHSHFVSKAHFPLASFGRSVPSTRTICHMIGFPPSPSAIE
jgi:hypothetical protein